MACIEISAAAALAGFGRWSAWGFCAAAALISASPPSGAAVAYPTKSLRLLAPSPPGGSVDSTARIVGPELSQSMGQPVVIDNRAGAGGILAADLVAKSVPDGHTLLLGTVSNAISPAVGSKLPFHAQKDFPAGTMLVDVMSGQVQVVLLSAPGLVPHVRAGRLRALAVTIATRSALLPELPTIAEADLPG